MTAIVVMTPYSNIPYFIIVNGVNMLLEIASKMKNEETGTLASMLCNTPNVASVFSWAVVTETVDTPKINIKNALTNSKVF